MIDFLVPFKSFIKLGSITIDNVIFRLHYKATVIILLISTLILTSKQFFGTPIQCMGNGEAEDKDAINSFCWVYGTYTLKSNFYGMQGRDHAYTGVGPLKGVNDEQINHTYYQWVGFVLLGQAVLFYLPRYLWKLWEEGRLSSLTTNLTGPIIPKEWSEHRRDQILSYFDYTSPHTHKIYALKYAFCELLNLINVISQIFIIDCFLGGAFRNYGAALSSFTRVNKVPGLDGELTTSPVDQFFPKLTKCWINMYGPSGSLVIKDRLCVLPLNLVNEKIFAILWFWYIFLATVSALALLFRIVAIYSYKVQSLLLLGKLSHFNKKTLDDIVQKYGFGGWFVLHLLGKNMNPMMFKDLVKELSQQMKLDACKINYDSNGYEKCTV